MDTSPHITPEQLELLLRQAQVGRNVNSVTHDANNYLGAIMAYAELIELEADLNQEAKRMVKELVDAVEQSSRLLGTLTTISRKDSDRILMCDLADLINRTMELFIFEIKLNRIEYAQSLNLPNPTLMVDEAKLQRVLMYMLSAAVDMLVDAGTSSLTVDASEQGNQIVVSVNADGANMTPLNKEGQWTTFVTLPKSGRPIVGLAIAKEICDLLEAQLTVSENTIQVSLPVPHRD